MSFKKLFPLLILVFTIQCTSTKNTQKNTADTTSNKVALISIEGMACQEGCADTIKTNLEGLKGVGSERSTTTKNRPLLLLTKVRFHLMI